MTGHNAGRRSRGTTAGPGIPGGKGRRLSLICWPRTAPGALGPTTWRSGAVTTSPMSPQTTPYSRSECTRTNQTPSPSPWRGSWATLADTWKPVIPISLKSRWPSSRPPTGGTGPTGRDALSGGTRSTYADSFSSIGTPGSASISSVHGRPSGASWRFSILTAPMPTREERWGSTAASTSW